jgi:hypothetical protein
MKTVFTFIVVLVAGTASAQTEGTGQFAIDWFTIDGGGGTSAAGNFSLTGTIGQHDASIEPYGEGDFVVAGGFWAEAFLEILFRDGFESN